MGSMDSRAGSAPTSRRFSAEQNQHAVRMVFALREGLGTSTGTVVRVARQLGYGVESLRRWVAQAEIDADARAGVTTAESAELNRLRQENRELPRANEILQRAAVFSGRNSTADSDDRLEHGVRSVETGKCKASKFTNMRRRNHRLVSRGRDSQRHIHSPHR